MSKHKNVERLEKLLLKKMKHNDGRTFQFLKLKQIKETITVITDSEDFEVIIYDIPVWLEHFTEVPDINVAVAVKPMEINTLKSDISAELRDILMENIRKVSKDKEYVNQAKQIANSVAALVNLAKVEIDIRTKL